ncbi:unnamed protein product [Urochloa humidicola]
MRPTPVSLPRNREQKPNHQRGAEQTVTKTPVALLHSHLVASAAAVQRVWIERSVGPRPPRFAVKWNVIL